LRQLWLVNEQPHGVEKSTCVGFVERRRIHSWSYLQECGGAFMR
jgi:hypothetical protein